MVEKTFRVRKGLDVEGPDKDASIINGVLTLGTIGNISGSSSSILAINSLGSVNINLDTDANDTISVFRIKEDNTDFFVIDNDGQVGIGTTAPATKLHIERSESDSENLMLRLRDSTVNAVGERIGIEGYWNTVPAGDIEFELTNTSSGASAIVFSPHSTGGTKTEAMRIASDGNVGIGSSAPPDELTVEDSASPVLGIYRNTNVGSLSAGDVLSTISFRKHTGASGNETIRIYNVQGDSGASGASDDYHTSDLRISTRLINSSTYTDRFTILGQEGYVGIGTTSPSNKLHVESADEKLALFKSTDAGAGIQIDSPNDGYSVVFFSEGGTDKWSLGKLASNSDKFSIYDEVNNTPRLVIDTSGRVGIGTTSPVALLHLKKNAYDFDDGTQDEDGDFHLMIKSDEASNTGDAVSIGFAQSNDATTVGAKISHVIEGSYSRGSLVFSTNSTASAGDTTAERMRITSAGNVGIGTTSPARPFHVVGDAYVQNGDILLSRGNFYLQDASDATKRGSFSSDGVWAWENVNVGIGTTSPDAVLNVISDTNDVEVLKIGNTAGNSGSTAGITHLGISHWDSGTHSSTRITATEDAAGSYRGSLSFGTRGADSDSAPTERMRILSNGKVGIGDSTPTTTLEVYDGSDANIRVRGNSNYATTLEVSNQGCKLHMGDIDSAEDSFLTFGAFSSINNLDTAARDFHLYGTNTTTGFYFDESAGKFGLGTTSPDYTLDVAGSIGVDDYIYHNGDSNTYILMQDDGIRLVVGNDLALHYEEDSTSKMYLSYNGEADVDIGNGDFFFGGSQGSYDGKMAIGSSTPKATLDVTATNNPTILLNARDAGYAADDKIGSLLFYNNEDSSGETGSRIGAGVRFVATDAYGRGRLELTAGTSSPMTSYNSTEDYTDNSIARLSILTTNGNVGIGTAAPASELHVVGHIQATTKSFVINHPSKDGMTLRHGSLEGPEHGVYVRGTLETEDSTEGFIELPDYWLELVDKDTITVQLTGKGRFQRLYVVKIEDNKVYVENEKMHGINCYYFIQAERKDVERMVVEY